MMGYENEDGYLGYVNGEYMLFCSEEDYYDFIAESEDMSLAA